MAFPVMSARGSVAQTTGTTHDAASALPAGIASGNQLMAYIVSDGGPTIAISTSGWNEFAQVNNGSNCATQLAYRIADGAETAFTFTTSTSENCATIIERWTNWHGTTPPEVASATGSSTTPDPPSLTPSWGSADTAWVAYCGKDSASEPSAYPANYTLYQLTGASGAGGGHCAFGIAARELAATSEDPGSFTIATEDWVAYAIGLPPAAGGTNYTRTLSDSATIVDTPERSAHHFRSQIDNAQVSTQIARAVAASRFVAVSVLDLIDSTARVVGRGTVTFDSISLSDTTTREQYLMRTLAEALATNDTISPYASFIRSLIESAIDPLDICLRTIIQSRSSSDNFAVTDSVARYAGLFRQAAIPVDLSDDVRRTLEAFRRFIDDPAIFDLVSRSITVPGGAIIERFLLSSASIADFASRTVEAYRAQQDATALFDASRSDRAITRILTEFIENGVVVSAFLQRHRIIASDVSANEIAARVVLAERLLRDFLLVEDAAFVTLVVLSQVFGFGRLSIEENPAKVSLSRNTGVLALAQESHLNLEG